MKDRFKFRLFDKPISEMSYDVCVGYIKDGVKRDWVSGWVCADTTCGQVTYTDKRLNDIVLMQCTGLKDKTGRLIYEGDILKDDSCGMTCVIEYHKPSYRIMAHIMLMDDYVEIDELLNDFGECPIAVIGNIYENPELLEGKK